VIAKHTTVSTSGCLLQYEHTSQRSYESKEK